MLVETLAGGVAAGLARLEQQRAAIAAQVRFEQFFTPELSRHLAAQPDLLDGRDSEVTLMFCDIRGFSRISERLSAEATFDWIGAIMTALSECVTAHQGVLVDYIGDELLAMWGAPANQPDHALLACRAALDMVETIQTLSPQWHDRLGEPFGVGIGLNSGQAHVGNTGSRQKFKYGPLGTNVNMASRVQGATKHLRCPLLITATTRNLIGDALPTRRVCKARVVNIQEPVELYELSTRNDESWQALRTRFEEALAEFEQGQFRESAKHLGRLLSDYPDDGPALVLLSRAVNAMVAHDSDTSPVWQLPGK